MSHTPSHRGDTPAEVGATRSSSRPTTEPGTSADVVEERHHTPTAYPDEAREKFGGRNWGACFFGWLVAIALAILLTSIVGAVVAAVGSSTSVTQSEAERQAGDIGLAAAIVLLVVLGIGYYFGGYVAGRMSRFDGGRQGLGVWLIGLVVTIGAIALGAAFGSQYNVLDRVSLPNLPISTEELGWGALVAALAVLALTLVAALFGGKAGHRYHDRVDRAAGRR
jgi:MFS family permease